MLAVNQETEENELKIQRENREVQRFLARKLCWVRSIVYFPIMGEIIADNIFDQLACNNMGLN